MRWNARRLNFYFHANNPVISYWFHFVPQLRHRSVRPAVFVPRCASWGYHHAGPPPRQEHHGVSTVALGHPVLDEHQHRPGHQEQPFHLRNAGEQPAVVFNLNVKDTVNSSLSMIVPKCFTFLSLQLGIPHTFVMMSYQYKFQDDDQTKIKGSIKYVVKAQHVLFVECSRTSILRTLLLVIITFFFLCQSILSITFLTIYIQDCLRKLEYCDKVLYFL